ncbi:O-methyltransferase family protein [Halenospora varia]|nr:O-methyltransferase family protein [Halenospora varia]
MAHHINSKEANDAFKAVEDYLCDAIIEPDAALESALKVNHENSVPAIDVAPNDGKLLYLITKMNNAKRILEVGTLGGYSAIWFCKALPEDGKLVTLEISPKHAEIAATNIANAGFSSKVEIKIGPALATLEKMARESTEPFDLIFVDANKDDNPGYFEWALKFSKKGTVIIIDNVVRYGGVVDPENHTPYVTGIRKFFEMLKVEKRVECTAIQTVGAKGWDGFALAVVH